MLVKIWFFFWANWLWAGLGAGIAICCLLAVTFWRDTKRKKIFRKVELISAIPDIFSILMFILFFSALLGWLAIAGLITVAYFILKAYLENKKNKEVYT